MERERSRGKREEGGRETERLIDVGKKAVVKKNWKPFSTLTALLEHSPENHRRVGAL